MNYDETILIMNKASEPLDINWKNMGLINSQFAFTRFFLFIFGLVIVIFVSSPAVIFNQLSQVEGFDFLKFEWTHDMGIMGTLLHKSGPPMIVLLLNTTIIWLLDYVSIIESYDTVS